MNSSFSDFLSRWFQSQFQVRLPLINSPLAGFLPVLIFATVLLLVIRMISTQSSSLLVKGVLLTSVSLIIGYSASLLVDEPAALGAFWLSLLLAVSGLVAVLLGVRINPGRDTTLLLTAGLLLILFSAYADLSIWLATNLAQATCQPFPGIITCQAPDFSILLILTLLWTVPGILAIINSSFYLEKTRKERRRFLEKRGKASAREEAKSLSKPSSSQSTAISVSSSALM